MADNNVKKMYQRQPRHSHAAFGYKREGKRWGVLLECGTGYLDFAEDDVDEIAAKFELDADVVREILQSATAHLFINRMPYGGSTGYFCIRPKREPIPGWIEERDPEPLEGPPPPEQLR
jgi:hypothetical protein